MNRRRFLGLLSAAPLASILPAKAEPRWLPMEPFQYTKYREMLASSAVNGSARRMMAVMHSLGRAAWVKEQYALDAEYGPQIFHKKWVTA